MEEDMMMPNVAPAPMMQETPMAPNLSEQMPAQTEEVSQAEMQEAQGALQQILQVIDMLIQQGLSAEEIAQFLEQYGISEDELEQAAQILGVDINQLLGGQMQQPQEPMMMAAGGPSESQAAQLQLAQMQAQLMQPSKMPIMQQPQMQQAMDNEPRFEDRSPENQIFSLQTSIDNLMSEYDMLVRNKEFDRAQAVANEINNIDVQISQIKAQMPMMMAAGGGTDFDEAGNPIVVTSPSTQVDTFMGPLAETGINFDTNMPTLQDTGMKVDASEIPAPSVKINVDYLNFMQPNGVLDEQSYGNAIERAREMEQSVQELLLQHEKAIRVANPQDKEMLIKNLSEYVNMVKKNENATIFSPSLPIEKKN